MNLRSSIAAAAAVAVLSACASTVDVPPVRPFAFLDVNTVSAAGSSSGYIAQAQGIFTKARIAGIIGSNDLAESCSPPAKIGSIVAVTDVPVEPGTVTMTLHGNVDTTTRTVTLRHQVLTIGDNWVNDQFPAMRPGTDTVIYKATGVAGAFPPFTVRAPTVAPYTAQSVDDSVTGPGIRVQWTASPNTASAMQIALQYADTSSTSPSTIPTREIVCIARDDGDFSINRSFVDEWQAAGVDSLNYRRQIVFSRFLTTSSTVNDAILAIVVRRDTLIVK
ncbi:MAG TPA: hypothetical protein VHM30_12070 [Gemmatimonadaceae bacterium]|nr:hypothetical protein [Gemmatimonadaceae bacterium]